MPRKLSTILIGDIVSSTSQMERSEEEAVHRFGACLNAVSKSVSQHEGRVFNQAGDAVLADFPSPVNALRAAMAARGALATLPGSGASDMRFGLHLADVMEIDGDLRGDGVNIAARIQSAADPGAIDASRSVFEQVRRNSPCVFEDLGERTFKGVSEPIQIYRVRDQMGNFRMRRSEIRDTAPPDKRPHSIAVARLTAASSAGEEQQALAEGLTEDLIFELGRMKQLFVLSSTASTALPTTDPKAIGDSLGVRYVLSGSMRMLGSRLRLNLTLTETETGRVLWSDRIQRPFDEFVEMMDDISARVTSTVVGRVLDADTELARSRPPASLTAYECYLRGLDYHRRAGVTDDYVRKAMHWFTKAEEADPRFARAKAMWVCSASILPEYDWADGRKRIQSALELDPNDPEANRIMGAILLKERKYDQARSFHEKAAQLAPKDAYVLGRCAAFHIFAGEVQKGLDLLDLAADLDPYLPPWIIEERIAAYYALGQYEQALDAARALAFQTVRSRLYRAAAHVALGDEGKAGTIVAEAMANSPSLSLGWFDFHETYKDRAIIQGLKTRLKVVGLPD